MVNNVKVFQTDIQEEIEDEDQNEWEAFELEANNDGNKLENNSNDVPGGKVIESYDPMLDYLPSDNDENEDDGVGVFFIQNGT